MSTYAYNVFVGRPPEELKHVASCPTRAAQEAVARLFLADPAHRRPTEGVWSNEETLRNGRFAPISGLYWEGP